MRFIIGLSLGIAAGFAGAILFAPDRSRNREATWPGATGTFTNGARRDGDSGGTFRRALRSLQEQINDAMSEAKQASEEAEAEMRARYATATGRKPKK